MKKILRKFNPLRCPATIAYIFSIILINTLFLWMPVYSIAGSTMTTADFAAGSIFVVRDFAQREIKHYILIAMLIGGGLTYLLVNHTLAIASISAFLVAESIDWSIFSFTKKPLSERLIWSSMLSCPADSYVFAHLAGLHSLDIILMTITKFLGVVIIWYIWKFRRSQQAEKCLT